MSYKNFPLAIFWYSPAVVALYHCAKIQSLSFSNKLSTAVAVLGLSQFFVFLSAQKFAPFYLKNYTSYGRDFSYPPITFAVVSESGKISQLGVMVLGLQCPKNAPRSRNFKIFTFWRGHCAKMLHVSGPEPVLFCTPRGPLVSAPTRLRVIP